MTTSSLLTLNIGLWVNGVWNANYGAGTAIREFTNMFHPHSMMTQNAFAKSGEPTLIIVAVIDPECKNMLKLKIEFLSELLNQDCIAGMLDGKGFLYGHNTEPYGDAFNPEFWLEPNFK